MKSQLWKIELHDNFTGPDSYIPIYEIFIPQFKLAVNQQGFFLTDENRYDKANHHPDHQPELITEVDIYNCNTIASLKAVADVLPIQEEAEEALYKIYCSAINEHYEMNQPDCLCSCQGECGSCGDAKPSDDEPCGHSCCKSET